MLKADYQELLRSRNVPFTSDMTVAELKLRLKAADVDIAAVTSRLDVEKLTKPVLTEVLKLHGAALPATKPGTAYVLKKDLVVAVSALSPALVREADAFAQKGSLIPVDVLRLVRAKLSLADQMRLSVAMGDREAIAKLERAASYLNTIVDNNGHILRVENEHVVITRTHHDSKKWDYSVACKRPEAGLVLLVVRDTYQQKDTYRFRIAGEPPSPEALRNDFDKLLTAVVYITNELITHTTQSFVPQLYGYGTWERKFMTRLKKQVRKTRTIM